jgi:membrane-associated protease RseP (regulator of RpoE activity)
MPDDLPLPIGTSTEVHYVAPPRITVSRSGQRYGLHAFLFGLTILTTLFWGAFMSLLMESNADADPIDFLVRVFARPELLSKGAPYSFAILLILLSHEMGHYLSCVYYRINATLPFFLPAPVQTGTFGAFIRIRSPFPNRKSLFDVGIAGPLAGFVVLLPFLYFGLKWSTQVPYSQAQHGLNLGEPLIFTIFSQFSLKPGMETYLHPVGFAAWFACLATSLNLLPIAQLDGGHVSYALFGKRAYYITWIFYAGLIGLAIHGFFISWISGFQWIFYCGMLLLLRRLAGFRHPPTLNDDEPIGWGRKIWGVIGLIVFILTFIPVTIRP